MRRRLSLASRPMMGIGNGAGEDVAVDLEDVGHGLVEADALADVVGKEGEAA